jgi:hypothetical protein
MRVGHWLSISSSLVTAGCLGGFRVGIAASLDEHARPGVVGLVGGTVGFGGTHSFALSTTIDGGAVQVKPSTVGVVRGALSLEWIALWSRVGFRLGAAIGAGRQEASDGGATFGLIGGRVAVLPVVFRSSRNTQQKCDEHRGDRVERTLHVGLAASADYQWATDRSLFTFGPTFEGYLRRPCFLY